MLSVRVGATWNGGAPAGGAWLHGLVPFGNLAFQTAFQRPTDNTGGGGMQVISWDMAIPGNLPLPIEVRFDSLVELFAGPVSLGAAVVSETPAGNTVTADGLYRLGEHFLAVDSGGAPTTNVNTAVTQAISRGLRWVDPGTLPSTSLSTLSETSAQPNTLSALLNAYCKANNKIWYIDRNHTLQIVSPPSTSSPDWALSPHVPNPQAAADDFTSAYFLRYATSLDATSVEPDAWAVTSASDPTAPAIREAAVDVSDLGMLSAPAAAAVAQAYLDANSSRGAFTEGVQVIHGQLTTLGGTAPELWAPVAGEVVRQPNWMTASGDLVLGDRQAWVIGGTQWKQGEPLTITPMGLAPRTVAQVVQAQFGRSESLAFS